MKTLFERLLWIAREVGIREADNKAVAALIGRSSGRVTQIKNEGEAASINGAALQRVVQYGFSPKWINEGKGEKRIKDASFSLPTHDDASIETKAAHVAAALSLILKAAGFDSDAMGSEDDVARRLILKGSRKSDASHSQEVPFTASDQNDKGDNDTRQIDTSVGVATLGGEKNKEAPDGKSGAGE